MAGVSPIEAASMYSPRTSILVIEDDEAAAATLRELIQDRGYYATLATTSADGLKQLASGGVHDLVVIDLAIPDLERWLLLSRLRSTPATARLPIIMLMDPAEKAQEADVLAAGADDYIAKPFSPARLLARVEALIRRSVLQSINPLTGLPGNRQVEQFIAKCARETTAFWAIAYIDIDVFKPFNDNYGFLQGDEVLKTTADLITKTVTRSRHDIFIGHIGGDDFISGLTSSADRSDQSCEEDVKWVLQTLASEFDELVKGFYSDEDLARGFLQVEGRRGVIESYPLMSISIAAVTNRRRVFGHPLEISSALASVKRKAKTSAGSTVCFDLRS